MVGAVGYGAAEVWVLLGRRRRRVLGVAWVEGPRGVGGFPVLGAAEFWGVPRPMGLPSVGRCLVLGAPEGWEVPRPRGRRLFWGDYC